MKESLHEVHGPLFDTLPHPDGKTYEPGRDYVRLSGQNKKVFGLIVDGRWRTLREIADAVEGSETGVSARLRDLRKAKFGGYRVESESVGGGVWRYRLVLLT